MEQYLTRGSAVAVYRPELDISYRPRTSSNTMLSGPNPLHFFKGQEAYVLANVPKTFVWPYIRNPIFSTVGMGSWLSDAVGVNADIGEAMSQLVFSVLNGIRDVIGKVVEIIAKLDWQKLAHVFMVELNPIHFTYQFFSTNPITEHLFRELDHFTGGLFTSVDKITTLSGRVLRGDAISKQELYADAMFVAKVALVVASGGTAAAIIAASSDQLKGGYLGESELGRALLTVATAAAIAYAVGDSVLNAGKNASVGLAQGEGEKQLIEKTPLGESVAGRFIAGASTRGAAAPLTDQNVGTVLSNYSVSTGKSIAKTEVATQVGGPYGSQIANVIVENGYPPPTTATGDGSGTSVSQNVLDNVWQEIKRSPDNVVNAIKNFNISVSNGTSTGSKIDIDPDSAGVPRSGTGDPFLSLPELNIPKIELPPKDLKGWEELFCKISFAVKDPKGAATQVATNAVTSAMPSVPGLSGMGANILESASQMCATRRRKILLANGKYLWIYELADGSYYWTFDEITIDRTMEYLMYFGLAAFAMYALLGGKKKKKETT